MKLRHSFFAFACASLFAGSSLMGCAADTATDPSADDENVEETSDELSAAGKKLIGAYKDDTGAFRGLVLTDEKVGGRNKFFADVDTGIRCIMAPCPSGERIEGTFTAGPKTITLYSTTASANVKHLLGRFHYLVQGSKLSLSRKDFAQSLSKEISYCAAPTDCYRQDIITPACFGSSFSCSSTNACVWSCHNPPLDPCKGKDQAQCLASAGTCQPVFGPSACTPDGRICTADMAFKGCALAH